MNIEKTNQKGFTLIETIIYVAIIGMVIGSFVSFSLSIAGSRNKTYSAQEVHANAREILNILAEKIHASDGINIGASTFNSDPGVLSLSMSDAGLDPTIIFLDQDDGLIQMTEGIGSAVNLSSDSVKITNLVFSNLSPYSKKESVRIQITAEYNGAGDRDFGYSKSFQTAVTVRK